MNCTRETPAWTKQVPESSSHFPQESAVHAVCGKNITNSLTNCWSESLNDYHSTVLAERLRHQRKTNTRKDYGRHMVCTMPEKLLPYLWSKQSPSANQNPSIAELIVEAMVFISEIGQQVAHYQRVREFFDDLVDTLGSFQTLRWRGCCTWICLNQSAGAASPKLVLNWLYRMTWR